MCVCVRPCTHMCLCPWNVAGGSGSLEQCRLASYAAQLSLLTQATGPDAALPNRVGFHVGFSACLCSPLLLHQRNTASLSQCISRILFFMTLFCQKVKGHSLSMFGHCSIFICGLPATELQTWTRCLSCPPWCHNSIWYYFSLKSVRHPWGLGLMSNGTSS